MRNLTSPPDRDGPDKPAKGPVSDAERQRRYRARQRHGMRMLTVELGPAVLERLVAEGWLNAEEAQDMTKIGDAIADLLDCYGRRTLQP